MTRSRAAALWQWLLAPRDVAALVAFRVVLGVLVAVSGARFLAYGWVEALFPASGFRFTYWGFAWVPALSAPWIHLLFASWVVLGLAVALGLFYRVTVVLLFLAFAWVQLIDVTNYLNHYYLVTLLLGLAAFLPLHRAYSLDVWRKPSLRLTHFPAWCTYLLRFQVAVVYVNAGLAKLNADWLLHAEPLRIWLSARTSLPVVGPLLAAPWVAYLAAWSGFLFDTFGVAFLFLRRTRPWAYVAVLVFHAATKALFPIGMFPFIMVASAWVFFDSDWPRKWWRWGTRVVAREAPPENTPAPGRWAHLGLTLALVYGVLQVALPLRTHLYGGDVSWHEQGMRFSWRVMTREKNGSVTYLVKDAASGREWQVSPRRYLTRLQEREMASQPDLILQMAHFVAKQFEAPGRQIEVRADAWVSMNGRRMRRFIDPSVDLTRVFDGLGKKQWVLDEARSPASATAKVER